MSRIATDLFLSDKVNSCSDTQGTNIDDMSPRKIGCNFVEKILSPYRLNS